MVVTHNHPSGDPTPSADDVANAERLVEAGALLGIAVQDHVIVSSGTEAAYSFRAAGAMPGPRPGKRGSGAREASGCGFA